MGVYTLPKILWQTLTKRKSREYLLHRLALCLPRVSLKSPVIWIHAVSMGETRAMIALYRTLREHHPHATYIISSVTETGHLEAKRCLKEAAAYFFLPFDLFIKKAVKLYQPDLLILVEGDYWANLFSAVKKQKGQIVVVSGKISQRSTNRFKKFPSLAHQFFAPIDHFCLQSHTIQERFQELGVPPNKITVTGNLKLDLALPPSAVELQKIIPPHHKVLVVGSTHPGEEKLILSALTQLKEALPTLSLTTLLVPRHPERFPTVATLLEKEKFPFLLYSKRQEYKGNEAIVLMDAMGLLLSCYQLADLAIVGGSFVPGIGGHNLFEPIACGVPVFFGPYVFAQPDLRKLVLEGEAGKEVSAEDLSQQLITYFQNTKTASDLRDNAQKVSQQGHGVTEKTYAALFPFLLNRK